MSRRKDKPWHRRPEPRASGRGRRPLWGLALCQGKIRLWLCGCAHKHKREAKRCRVAKKAGRRIRKSLGERK